jgi:hypothetical protein
VTEQRAFYPKVQHDPAAAVEEAKDLARAEGLRIKTVARLKSRSNGRYTVTLAVEVPA